MSFDSGSVPTEGIPTSVGMVSSPTRAKIAEIGRFMGRGHEL